MVTVSETLKEKQHTMITTRQAFKDGMSEEMEILSSNHVFVEEDEEKNLSQKMLKKSPASFKEGNQPINGTKKSVDQDGIRVFEAIFCLKVI